MRNIGIPVKYTLLEALTLPSGEMEEIFIDFDQAATSRSLSHETNTEVTKTAIHRLTARGWLQKGVNPIDSPY